MLAFHEFTEGMAAAAMRIVLRDIVKQKATAHTSGSSHSASFVHPIVSDLHMITGHAMHRVERDGSVLQPAIIQLLKQQGIHCQVNPNNMGRLIVTSSELQQYAKRVSR
jgi:hypothetical protein